MNADGNAPPAADDMPTYDEVRHMLMADEPEEEETSPSILQEATATDDDPTIEQIKWALGVNQTPDRRGRPRPSLLSPQMANLLDGNESPQPLRKSPSTQPVTAAPSLLSDSEKQPEPKATPVGLGGLTSLEPDVWEEAVAAPMQSPPKVAPASPKAATTTTAPVRPVPSAQPRKPVTSAPPRPPNPTMYLGTIKDDAGRLFSMVAARTRYLLKMHQEKRIEVDSFYKHQLMHQHDYIYTVKNRKTLYRELLKQQAAKLPPDHPDHAPHHPQINFQPAVWTFLLQPQPASYTPDEDGWIRYLKDRHPKGVADVLNAPEDRALYKEEGRQEHTLIVAPSKWGKSELIKALLYHYAQDGSAAVVVLDPGGDLVKQVRKWPELVREDRLCLIQPGLDQDEENDEDRIGRGLTIGFNPLDGTDLDIEERRVIAADWAYTLGMIGAHQHDLTPNMIYLVTMCVQVMLTVPGATLADLGHLLMVRPPRARKEKERPEAAHPRAAELQRLARDYEVSSVAEFFRHGYDIDSVEGTREALRRRISTVLNYPHAEAMLTGSATINLEAEIEARRFILVDLSRFKKTGGAAMGRLFLAQVAAIGRRRESRPQAKRTPTHIFVDEASTMVSASMFEITREMRKYGIYLTLAQQVAGDEMTPEQKERLKIVRCKLIAPADVAAKWIVPNKYNTIPDVDPCEFVVEWAGFEDIHRVKIRSDLAGYKHSVSQPEWRDHLRTITGPNGYYRSAELGRTVPLNDNAGSQVQPPPREQQRDDLPDGVSPELLGKFTSKTGLPGDW